MKTLKDLYKVGNGPSSSHTMAPSKAARLFLAEQPDADLFEVILYESLAKTGKGHRTDRAITQAMSPLPVSIIFDTITKNLPHPNTMDFIAYKEGQEIGRLRVLSVGGGDVYLRFMI